MNLIHTLLAFIVALGTLVIVHELGHFWVARWCGVKVLRFSVGMGRVICSRRFGKDQTEWALSILPLGGYVKMLDAREQDLSGLSPQERKREFTSQSVWRRIAIVAAGPIANFILAILLFTGLYMHGMPEPLPKLREAPAESVAYQAGIRANQLITAIDGQPVSGWSDVRWRLLQLALDKKTAHIEVSSPRPGVPGGALLDTVKLPLNSLSAKDMEGDFLRTLGLELARPPAVLGQVAPDGPAMRAGLHSGDLIQSVDGVAVADGLAFVRLVRASPERPLHIQGLRGQQRFSLDITPDKVAGTDGGAAIGRIQVEVAMLPEMATVSDDLPTALSKAAGRTWDTSLMTVKMLGRMLIGEVSWKNITGPITIADYAGQTARIGVISYLSFMALISISLGVMNLLPIPVLDGGHLLYYSVEILTGRPVSERFSAIAQRAGLGVLMTLMLVAAFNDIVRLMF
ncbi:RIP metalloprotease RseP [Oxalobacteraceae bacterium CAVE-383]|nr:RIP metalloprotease RseP [Oxalobacteraceae bacterium CAVE-383]